MGRRRKGRGPGERDDRPARPQGSGDARGNVADNARGNATRNAVGPSRWGTPGTAPRRPYAGPGGRWHQEQRTDFAGRYSAPVEDTSPSRYSRAQRGGGAGPGGRPRRPRPPGPHDHRPRPQPPPDAGRRPPPPRVSSGGTLDPFELFCAYHLGITDQGGYRIQNIHEVARRFGTNAGALKQTLVAYGMEADDIVHSGFDLAGAQLDIMVAPEGVSRRELARPLYDEFKSAPRRARNWSRELEEAEREIERTIGREGRWSPGPRDAGGKQ
jgi:hypothetical protein